jgi:hypothetical protein
MRAITVEVGSEIEQLVLEIRARPEQRAIETLPPYRSDQPVVRRKYPGSLNA